MSRKTGTDSDIFEHVVRLLDEPLVVIDSSRRVVFMNLYMGRLTGADPQNCQGRALGEALGVDESTCEAIAPAAWIQRAQPDQPWEESVTNLNGTIPFPARVRRRAICRDTRAHAYVLVIHKPGKWEQRYRDILAGSPDIFFECRKNGCIAYGADQLADALHRPLGDIKSAKLSDLVVEHQRPFLNSLWQKVLTGESARLRELTLLAEGGNQQHYWVALLPVRDRFGKTVGVRGVAGDIRAQKGLAHALEAADERFNVLFRESSDPVLILSMDADILAANQAFEEFTGLRTDELFSGMKGWKHFTHPEDIEHVLQSIRKCARDGYDEPVEMRMLDVSGQSAWFEQSLSVLHDENGNTSGVVVVARNIERRKQRESALREKAQAIEKRHQRAQLMVTRLKDFFMHVGNLPADIDGYLKGVCNILYDMYEPHVLYLNIQQKEKRLFTAGHKLPADIRRSIKNCLPNSICAHMMETGLPLYIDSLDETEPYSRQHAIKALGLKTCLGAPLRDSKGVVRGTMAMLDIKKRDYDHVDVELITVAALHLAARLRADEQEEINRELADHLRQSQKMEAVGMLAGGIAHDFNNILSGILGFSSYLLSKAEAGTTLHRDLGLIEQSAVRASELTRQLLAFARRKHFAKEPLSLNKIIQEVLSLLERSIAKNIVIRKELHESLPAILGDVGQLNQVIMNLCLNAADAMAETGGELTLHTGCRPLTDRERAILIDTVEGDYVNVTLSDTGVGMDEVVQEHIFDPFFTTKTNGRGTGLGLSIVYGIVNNHGGHIVANSEEGKGSTFTLYFPVCGSEIVEEGEQQAVSFHGTETLMVVDDEPIVRQMVTEILKEQGYKVISASSGMEAIDYIRELKGQIDLVLLDMVMPEMDGVATFEEMQRIDGAVPILLTSGFVQEERSRKLIERGALGLIYKPYKSEALLERIRQCFEKQQTSWR